MSIEELFAIINSAYTENTLSLSSERLAGTPAASAIKGNFEQGIMILVQASKPELRDGAVVINSGKPAKMFTLHKSATASAVWTTDGTAVFMNVTLVPDGQTTGGLSLRELYPKLASVYLSTYRFSDIRFEIDSRVVPVEFDQLQEKYAEGLFHPAAGTFYSAHLKFTANMLWPEQLQRLQEVFGKDKFEATGQFQLVNGMMRYFISVNGTTITLGQLTIATDLELFGLLLDSTDEPTAETEPEADAMQIFAGIFSLPGELALNKEFRFETFWQVAVPEMLTIRSGSISNVPGLLKDFSKKLLNIDLPDWEIPGLSLLSTFSLEQIEIVFDSKRLALVSVTTRFSLLDEQHKLTLIENLLTLDKIGIELGVTIIGSTPSFYSTVTGSLTINDAAVTGPFVTEVNLPACSFSIGLGEFSTLDAGALIRRAIPFIPETTSLIVGDLMLTGDVRNPACSFLVSTDYGTSIDLFLFKLEEFEFQFDYVKSGFTTSAGASASASVLLTINDNISIGLSGSIDSQGWTVGGSLELEEKIYLTELLPAGLGIPTEIGGLSFKGAEVTLKKGTESGVTFIVNEPLDLSFGDAGNLSVKKLELSYTSTKDSYEWKIICTGEIALIKENPTDKPWLIHGNGELSITKNNDGFSMSFLSKDGITVEKLPVLIPYKVSTSGIEWSELKFSLKEITLAKTTEKGWSFVSAFKLNKVKLPEPFFGMFPDAGIDVKLSIDKTGVSIGIIGSFLDYIIPSVTIPAVGELPEFKLGQSRVVFGDLTLTIGKVTGVECALKYWLPERTNYLLGTNEASEPKIKLFDTFNPAAPDAGKTVKVTFYGRLKNDNSGPAIGATVSELPLLPLEKKGEYYLLNLGPKPAGEEYGKYGCLKFKMPEFAFDVKKGGFTFGTDFGIEKTLAIPLGPLKYMLANGVMKEWTERLPDAIPIPFPFNPGIFKNNELDVNKAKLFYKTMSGKDMPEGAVVVLDKIAGIAKQLPDGLKQYLTLNDPDGKFELKFKVVISPKGSVDIFLSSDPGLKMLNFNPPTSVQGIVLRSFSFGTLLGGQLFSTRIDADFEQFDFVQLLASLVAPPEAYPYIGTPQKFGTKISIHELFVIIIYQTTIPIPVPIFYKKFGIEYYGLGDFGFEAGISFPEPEFDLLEAIGLLGDLVKFVSQKDFKLDPEKVYEHFKLVFAIEPTNVTVPKLLGGNKYGLQQRQALSLYKIFAIIANSIKFASIDSAVNVIPLDQRFRLSDHTVPVKLACMTLPQVDWILSTPAEFFQMAHTKLNLDAAQANQWLSIIPGTTDTTPVKPTDNGIIAYFRGTWVTSYSDFECVFGLVALSVNNFRLGLRVKGKVRGLFDFEAYAFSNVKPSEPYFFIYGEGKTNIRLIGLQIFEGETQVVITQNHFVAKGYFHILNDNALFYIGGVYSGKFDEGQLNLSGGLRGKLLVFELEGSGRIANDGIGGEIGFTGRTKTGFDITVNGNLISLMVKLDLGWTTFFAAVGLQPNDNNPILDLNLKSTSIAGLIGLEIVFHCQAFDTRFQGEFFLTLFNNRVLNGWAKIDGGNLAAGGQLYFSLIPGTSIDVQVKGFINGSSFSLSGSGTLKVGIINTGIFLEVSTNGIRGRVTILNVDYGLSIISCNGQPIIILTAVGVTSYIDKDGFHFNKQPPCTDSFVPASLQETGPCRVKESAAILFEGISFAHKSQKKILASRSASFTKIASRRKPDYTITLYAARKKTTAGKPVTRTLLVLHPKGNQLKLMKELRQQVQLLMRSKATRASINLTGAYFELEINTTAGKASSILSLILPETATAKAQRFSYRFKGLFPGYEFFRIIAAEFVDTTGKSKSVKSTGKPKAVRVIKKKVLAGNKKKIKKKPAKKSKAAATKKKVSVGKKASKKAKVKLKPGTRKAR